MKPKRKTILGQPSWMLANRDVELAVTELGGHMAPVTFHRNSAKPVQPYYISPWQGQNRKLPEPVLVPLRGDFFCMPFGAPGALRGVKHACHGEPVGRKWTLAGAESEGSVRRLTMTLKTTVLPGTITKTLSLVEGHNVVYCRHVLEGYSGAVPLGHHETIALPDRPGAMRVAVSPFKLGMTNPTLFSDPANREYQSLAIGAEFKRLDRVPLIFKDPAIGDCSRYPTRTGYTDLLAVWARGARMAWTTATNTVDGYMWFSLKDPSVLPATVMWISNRGRHGEPWDGQNCCIGLEDVCAYFANTPAESAGKNRVNKLGIPTTVKLTKRRPTAVNLIQGVVKVPRGFECVKSVRFTPGEATFTSITGKTVTAPVCHEFIKTGSLEK